jgi:hypothetical protein
MAHLIRLNAHPNTKRLIQHRQDSHYNGHEHSHGGERRYPTDGARGVIAGEQSDTTKAPAWITTHRAAGIRGSV